MGASYWDIANSSLVMFLVIGGLAIIIVFALVFLKKSWARAYQLGYTKEQLMSVVKSSFTTSIVPSFSIVIGVISLSLVVGKYWAQWRLSVIGALGYEIPAAEMALQAVGVEDAAAASGSDFTLVMYVMSIGILGGLIVSLFLAKKIQQGTMKLGESDANWGALGTSTFMLTLIVAFVVPMIFQDTVTLLTLATSAVLAVILTQFAKALNIKWLSNFILAICLLGAMASSVLWTNLFGGA